MFPVYERHPLSAEYSDLSGQAWEAFLDGMRHGLLDLRITIHDGMVLDGWQRYRGCKELGLIPATQDLPNGWLPEEFVIAVNDHRRHESETAQAKRIEARRVRVAAARVEGKSLRTIAEEEGVSESQVRKDIGTEAGAHQCAPAPKEGKVTGKDGKTYKARAPKAESKKPAKPQIDTASSLEGETNESQEGEKNDQEQSSAASGRSRFDDSGINRGLLQLLRAFESRAQIYGNSKQSSKCFELMEQLKAAWNRWLLHTN